MITFRWRFLNLFLLLLFAFLGPVYQLCRSKSKKKAKKNLSKIADQKVIKQVLMKVEIQFTGFEQKLLLEKKPFVAKIFEGEGLPPPGFNGLRIPLDLSVRSLLNWQKESLLAQAAVERGLCLLWEIQLGLDAAVLEDEALFLTLQLNVQHFNDTLWKQFQQHSFGVALFRGILHQRILDDLKSLAALLDEEARCFLFLDTRAAIDVKSYLQCAALESLGYFCPILKGEFAENLPYAFPTLGWGHGASSLGFCAETLQTSLPETRLSYAICLPETPCWEEVHAVVHQLGECPFRIIPEAILTQEWEGIDRLIVFPRACTEKTHRKLRGFEVAGGEIINYPNGAAGLQPLEIFPPFFPAFSQRID